MEKVNEDENGRSFEEFGHLVGILVEASTARKCGVSGEGMRSRLYLCSAIK